MSVSILRIEQRLAAHGKWCCALDCVEDCWRWLLKAESREARAHWYGLMMAQYEFARTNWRIWQGIA